ncbi:MAG: TlpA family protein disulfide reductase [Oceanospirillaceae bacterium]|nr:TlpA family protein disulfide reductase [Oceanospirillaceae bacterium]MCP5351541.1 TlpA family protein disulfide reductase [Oceanospirillaceae bacterium]
MKKLIVAGLLSVLSMPLWAVEVGQSAPDFKLSLLDGSKSVKLSDYRGQVVYLDFWASWCGPCRQSLPAMNSLQTELFRKGFTVLAVNVDEDANAAKAFLKQFPVNYPVVADAQGATPDKFGLQGMPTSYLIDKNGKIALVHQGYKEGDLNEIRQTATQLLKK